MDELALRNFGIVTYANGRRGIVRDYKLPEATRTEDKKYWITSDSVFIEILVAIGKGAPASKIGRITNYSPATLANLLGRLKKEGQVRAEQTAENRCVWYRTKAGTQRILDGIGG